MGKSRNTNYVADLQPVFDGMEVVFQVQLKMLWDTIECLESFFESLGVPAPWRRGFPFGRLGKGVTNTVKLAYKFRLSPDDAQKEFLAKHFGCTRFVYNYFLDQRRQYYKETHRPLHYNDQAHDLTKLKKQPEYAWLREVCSQALQQALRHLDEAFKNFYAKRARCPKFHSRNGRNSFTLPQSVRIEDGLLWLPKFKNGIPIILHREIKGKIGMVTVSKTPGGDYYASFTVTQERAQEAPTFRAVGLDLGIKSLAVTSDAHVYENPKYLGKYQRELAHAQKCLARKEKGSRSYERQRIKVAKIHEKIRNCRMDHLHKCALDLVRKYDIIGIEDLNVRGMIRNRRLSKSIADASWGTFVTVLKYKALWNGRTVVEVPRFFPSSQTCSHCGYINKETKDLKVRKWVCPRCGMLHDRDLNASLNIKNLALKMLCEQAEKHM